MHTGVQTSRSQMQQQAELAGIGGADDEDEEMELLSVTLAASRYWLLVLSSNLWLNVICISADCNAGSAPPKSP